MNETEAQLTAFCILNKNSMSDEEIPPKKQVLLSFWCCCDCCSLVASLTPCGVWASADGLLSPLLLFSFSFLHYFLFLK